MIEKFESIAEAVWFAAAIMSFKKKRELGEDRHIDREDFYFRQVDIKELADKMCSKFVGNARVSQHLNGTHLDSSRNVLVGEGQLRRLSFRGEFNGIKERPATIDIEQEIRVDGESFSISEILNFIDNEYTELFKEETNIECMEIVEVEKSMKGEKSEFDRNAILYGPPGTGKTYNTIKYAVSIVEDTDFALIDKEDYNEVKNRYLDYVKSGQVMFTTFHQSYGYEEFIEGIKPVLSTDETSNDLNYRIEAGIFKNLCERAMEKEAESNEKLNLLNDNPKVWKVSLDKAGLREIREFCFNNDMIRINWDEQPSILNEEVFNNGHFTGGKPILKDLAINMKKGDIVVSLYNKTTIDAVGIVTGDYEYIKKLKPFARVRKVQWLVKDKQYRIYELNNNKQLNLDSVYRLKRISADQILDLIREDIIVEEKEETAEDRYVLIVDEINRGNISKIFGELITLIEPSKRLGKPEELKVKLPYSRGLFGVPDNVYILGTMNTADRSIALLDTALRRRFKFIEMMPDESVLVRDGRALTVSNINIGKMLGFINRRIEVLLDRDHMIGHAYFMGLIENNTMDDLGELFEKGIIPLLQEYFYDDYEKIRLILGDNQKDNEEDQFIIDRKIDRNLFGKADDIIDIQDMRIYDINKGAFKRESSYTKIYLPLNESE